MTTTKKILVGLAVIVPLGTLIGLYIWISDWLNNIWKNINWGIPSIDSADFKGLTIQDFANIVLAGSEKTIQVTLSLPIKNDSDTDVTFSKFRMKLYYDNTLIAQTSDDLYTKSNTIPAHGSKSITDTIDVNLNKAGGKLLVDKVTGKNPQIGYEVDITILGLPISMIYPIKGTFAW